MFSQAGNAKLHAEAVHDGMRPFACRECDASFSTQHQLDSHIAFKHKTARPYVCIIEGCGYKCVNKNCLDVHMRKHTGDRPYPCTEKDCDHRSKTASNRRVHLEQTHDIGKHKCDTCLGNRNSQNEFVDSLGTHSICNMCYMKVTGCTTRVEKKWLEYLDKEIGTVGIMASDDSLQSKGGCARVRPDRMYGSSDLVELLECDEQQHLSHDHSCEQKRISIIYEEPSIMGRPMSVVRWNPDGYKAPRGTVKVTSLEEKMHLSAYLVRRLREERAKCDPHAMPRVVVFYMFYSRDNSGIVDAYPHYFCDSEADIDKAVAAVCRSVQVEGGAAKKRRVDA
jgi:hypothetical protein